LPGGIAKSSLPFDWGVGLCPTFPILRVACGDAQKEGIAEIPRTPAGTLRSLHPRFFEFLFQKFGVAHGKMGVQQSNTI
jgi:hypothetical protein